MSEFTFAEVAARLRISARTLRRRISESGLAFARPGRSYLFTEDDFKILFEAIRQCRSGSSHLENERAIASISSVGQPTAQETSRFLQRRETKRLLKNFGKTSSTKSSGVVALDLERR